MIVDMHAHIIPETFPPAGSRPSAWTWPSMDHFEAGRARVMIGGENYRTVHDGNWNVDRRLRDMRAHGADVQVISPMPVLVHARRRARLLPLHQRRGRPHVCGRARPV